jgi:hypothetical protein
LSILKRETKDTTAMHFMIRMSTRKVTLQRFKNGADISEDSIRDWQEAGIAAIWTATWELSLLGLELRGLNRNSIVPMRSCQILRYRLPWLEIDSNCSTTVKAAFKEES